LKTSHVIVIFLIPLERSAYTLAECCQDAGIKSKNHDELINFTGVVSKSVVFLCEAGFDLKAQFLFLVLEQD
jgi:hypothetical protein